MYYGGHPTKKGGGGGDEIRILKGRGKSMNEKKGGERQVLSKEELWRGISIQKMKKPPKQKTINH